VFVHTSLAQLTGVKVYTLNINYSLLIYEFLSKY